MRKHGRVPSLFCVTDFADRCNVKENNFEETNFVKWAGEDCEVGVEAVGVDC